MIEVNWGIVENWGASALEIEDKPVAILDSTMLRALVLLILVTAGHDSCDFSEGRKDRKNVAAVVLARGGSKGIPLKNLALVGGRSLLRISLEEALSVGFDSVWVSTEHPDIRSEAERRVNVHWRSSENAEDWSSSVDALREFVSCRPEVDVVALLQCTSPFQHRKYLAEALERIRGSDTKCVFSVTKSSLKLWSRTGSGVLTAVNFDAGNRRRRQDYDVEVDEEEEVLYYNENGMFYFADRDLIESGLLQSKK